MAKKIYIFIFSLVCMIGFGQSDNDQDQQQIYVYLFSKNLEKAKKSIDDKFLQSNNDSKKVIGYLYLADYYTETNQQEQRVAALEKAKDIASKTKSEIDQAYVNLGYAKFFKDINKSELFFKSINKSIGVFSKSKQENFILALIYDYLTSYARENPLETPDVSYYDKANTYALKSKNPTLINWTYNNWAIHYSSLFISERKDQFKNEAEKLYNQSLKYTALIIDPDAKNTALGTYYNNYGYFLFETSKDNLGKSKDLFEKALTITKKQNNGDLFQFYAHTNLGYIYEKTGQYDLAEKHLLKALKQAENKDPLHKVALYQNLALVYNKLNNSAKSLEYYQLSTELLTKHHQNKLKNNIKSLEIYYKVREKNEYIKQLEVKNNLYNTQRLLSAGIFLLALLGIVLLIYTLKSKNKLNKQKTELLKAEHLKTELKLQLEKEEKQRLETEQELLKLQQERLQKEALASSLRLDHKRNVINEIKDKANLDTHLKKILKEEQLTDNDFEHTQNLIQNIHPNLFKKTQEVAITKLTNQDLKYIANIFLNMDNLQISKVLKADINTVRVTKYRLKQKLGLGKDDDLALFVKSLV